MQALLDHFLSLALFLGDRVQGWERSAKITPASFSDQRWLFGFDKQQLSWTQVVSHPYFNDFPPELLAEIHAHWEQANFCYCAIDLDPSANAKFYLEFPVLLSIQTPVLTEWAEPAIWCTGYKCNQHLGQSKQSHYYLLPGFSIHKAFDQTPILKSYDLVNLITHFFESLAPSVLDSIDILRLGDFSEARGLDLRLYDLNLRVSDLTYYLIHSSHQFEWLRDQQKALVVLNQHWGGHALGHISLGVGEDQQPYINIYWAAN